MTKLTSLPDAVASLIHDGDCIYAAGFTHLIPFAAGHEIIRQKRQDLVLARATPDLIYDQMIARELHSGRWCSWSAGNPGVGLLKAMRAAIEAGRLEWEEYSHFSMISRLTAGAAGLPFLPMNPTATEDLARVNPNFKRVTDPYSGREVVTVPALNPDVAIVHVPHAVSDGNCPAVGHPGRAARGRLRRRPRPDHRRGDRRPGGDPLRSEPHAHPRLHRRRRVSRAPLLASVVLPGVLRPRQRLFYLEWDKHQQRSRGGSRPGWPIGCMASTITPRTGHKLGPETHRRLQVEPRWSEPVNYGKH